MRKKQQQNFVVDSNEFSYTENGYNKEEHLQGGKADDKVGLADGSGMDGNPAEKEGSDRGPCRTNGGVLQETP